MKACAQPQGRAHGMHTSAGRPTANFQKKLSTPHTSRAADPDRFCLINRDLPRDCHCAAGFPCTVRSPLKSWMRAPKNTAAHGLQRATQGLPASMATKTRTNTTLTNQLPALACLTGLEAAASLHAKADKAVQVARHVQSCTFNRLLCYIHHL